MATLYAHIGIPKSGTTTVQNNLMRDPRINYINTFYFHKADYWQTKDFELAEDKTNIVSNETFSVRGEHSGKIPLRSIMQRLTDECEDVRILLTIRNQNTALSSMFRFRILNGAYFHDFEDWLNGDEGMDYYAATQYGTLIRSLIEFVPLHRIRVLFFEELATSPASFYEQLYQFLNLSLDPKQIEVNRHSNPTSPPEFVYAKNVANRFITGRFRTTRRVNSWMMRLLAPRFRNRIPADFFNLETVKYHDHILDEIRQNNQLLVHYFPELQPHIEEYGYPLQPTVD
ncbi:sulfotransferase domain-containing protein [Novipirellula sp. SH528]|uniref:sulfotransferase domain-containing protein n=1 Tax=Novipirellula sp. SH528 TaxID=3454466 RepID=UPI003FA175FB